ncbi:MAG TPA: non-homologous end-joining DNA ligase [Candidatus Limnocylindrales bacterium]|nr:non-homologous end-joining DNA ligase [Candidatus Limnocylindrales bacterium]
MSANEIAIKVNRRVLTLSNPNKVLYPGGRVVKAQVLDYYLRAGPFLLPHFKNRPVTLLRYPDGVFGESFYEKNAPGFTPNWVKTFKVPRSEGGTIDYILINNLPTLAWLANLAALELHPFLHKVPNIDRPTHVVFDLDPGEGVDILGAAEIAFLIRDLLEGLRLKSFAKVSGSKGIQLYVPLNRAVTYDMTSAFARAVANLLSRKHPDRVVSEMAKVFRKGKVFIDWSQNSQTKTTIGSYSLRAKRERPFVSMPVTWSELKSAIRRSSPASLAFEPEAALKRLNKLGDLFEPVLQLKQQLPAELTQAVHSMQDTKRLNRYVAQ